MAKCQFSLLSHATAIEKWTWTLLSILQSPTNTTFLSVHGKNNENEIGNRSQGGRINRLPCFLGETTMAISVWVPGDTQTCNMLNVLGSSVGTYRTSIILVEALANPSLSFAGGLTKTPKLSAISYHILGPTNSLPIPAPKCTNHSIFFRETFF